MRRKWDWKVVVLVGYCVALAAFSRRLDFWLYRHRYPGQWLGEAGMFRNADVILFVCLLLAAGIGLSFYLNRRFYALMMMAIMLAYSSVSPRPFQYRAGFERPDYERAIRTKTKFGDQFEARINDRRVVFWRWITYDMSQGEGVVYDPTGLLEKDVPSSLWYGGRQDMIHTVTRLWDGYYYVTFT
jgi:hypothetical protein